MSLDAVSAHRERLQRFAALPDIPNLGALVAEAARLYPERAIIDFFEDGESLTAAALHELSDRFANGLAAIGLRKGDHVGVMLPNRLEYPVTYLAIAKLGAVMVPINPRYTARELHYVLTDAQVSALVIDAEHLPLFDSLADRPAALENARVVVRGAAAIEGSRSWAALCAGGAPSFVPTVPVTKDDLLTILYTSGTTGFPKGCLLPQDYWLMLARATCAWTELPVARMLLQNPFHYMNCQFVLPTALMLGATLHVAARPSASKFIPWIKQLGIEWCVFPEIVLKQPEAADDARTRLKLALLAAVSPGGQVEIERRFKVPARELYGMSEIGAGLAMPVHVTDMPGSNSVGIEMLLRRATIRGEDGAPVKPGEPGELWMAGRGIMKGYFNKPEANADAFRGDWFRTGDVTRQDERGFFYIIGRLKDMVRRSGENVAAREVEAVALLLPEVKEAAVVPVPDKDRGEEVKIFLALQEGVPADEATIARVAAHCRANLASYKVPRYYAFLPELPRTASNKIEKGKLKTLHADPRQGAYDTVNRLWR